MLYGRAQTEVGQYRDKNICIAVCVHDPLSWGISLD